MIPQSIKLAECAIQKYKTRDPFEIIEQRKIKLRMFTTMPTLLGYYTVVNRKQYIGINAHANEEEQVIAAGHELGHSFLDYKTAVAGTHFEDTMAYSISNSRCEINANLFDAELLLEDDYILELIHYDDYRRVKKYIDEHIGEYKSKKARYDFEQEQLMNFWDNYSDIPAISRLAAELGTDEHLVEFKLQALSYKGYDLPNLPELKADFLRRY